MMRISIALFVSVIAGAVNAQSGVSIIGGGTTTGSTTLTLPTSICAGDSDSCAKSDLVIKSRDKTVLIRGVYGCQELLSKLRPSSDVTVAECFR